MLDAQNGATDAKLRHDEHGNLIRDLGEKRRSTPRVLNPDLRSSAWIEVRRGTFARVGARAR